MAICLRATGTWKGTERRTKRAKLHEEAQREDNSTPQHNKQPQEQHRGGSAEIILLPPSPRSVSLRHCFVFSCFTLSFCHNNKNSCALSKVDRQEKSVTLFWVVPLSGLIEIEVDFSETEQKNGKKPSGLKFWRGHNEMQAAPSACMIQLTTFTNSFYRCNF